MRNKYTSAFRDLSSIFPKMPKMPEFPDFPEFFESEYETTFFKIAKEYPFYDMYIDTVDDKTTCVMKFDVAGFNKSELEVSTENDILNISGKKPQIDPSSKKKYYHTGLANANFTKQFRMPANAKVDSISLAEGILTIVIDYMKPEKKEKQSFDIK